MSKLEIFTFGGIRCVSGGSDLRINSTKQKHLLGCLVAAPGRSLTRDELIECLWPDVDQHKGQNRFKQLLSSLRTTLTDEEGANPITRLGDGYSLIVERNRIDIERFEGALRQAWATIDGDWNSRIALLSKALLEVAGRPFGDLHGYNGIADEAARLDQQILSAEIGLLEAKIASGAVESVVGEIESRMAQNEYDEALWYLHALALHRLRRSAEAVKSVDSARRVLGSMGLEISPRLRKLETRILMHDPELSTEPPTKESNLPADISSFVGRRREVEEVRSLLQADGRLITLTGVGGIGKTRLAIQVARQMESSSPFSVFAAFLSGLRRGSPLGREVARQLGVSERPPATIDQTLGEWIGDRHVILIMDNCEHVVEDAAEFSRFLLRRCPNLRVLATSRRSLHVPGERLFPLGPMDSATVDGDAMLLVADRLGIPTSGDVDAAMKVCERLSGIPLAIELAASRQRVFGWAGLLSRLDDVFSVLGYERFADAPHQHTLHETIRWSYELLTPEEKALIVQLSVFRGGLTVDAAEAVFLADSVTPVVDLVASLVDASLLEASRAGSRFTLLEPVRQFASAILAEEGMTEATEARHSAYFTARAAEGALALAGPERSDWLTAFDREHKNLLAALDGAIGRFDSGTAAALALNLSQFWVEHGHLEEGLEWLLRIRELEIDDQRMASDIARQVSFHQFWMGDLDAAEVSLDEADTLARDLDPTTKGLNAHQRGNIVGWGRGSQREAIRYFEHALDSYELVDFRGFAAQLRTQVTVAYLYVITGDEGRAQQVASAARQFSESLGGIELVDHALAQVEGWAAFVRGDVDTAVVELTAATGGFKAMGMKPLHAATLYNLAWAELYRGNPTVARSLTQQSMEITWERGSLLREAHGLDTLARIALAESDAETASILVAQSLEVSVARRDVEAAFWASRTLAAILQATDRADMLERVRRHVKHLAKASGVVVPVPVIQDALAPRSAQWSDSLERAVALLEAFDTGRSIDQTESARH